MRKIIAWFSGRAANKDEAAGKEIIGTVPNIGSQNRVYETQVITGIEWVDNDGLLRDEGVLFGIADADYSLKVESIKSSFDKVKSAFIINRNQLLDSIKAIEKEEDGCLDLISQIKKEIELIRLNPITGTHNFLPGLMQLLMYAGICFFNYYLLVYWLRPVFPDQHFIPLGLYLFGLLSVFMGKALMYNTSDSTNNASDGKREKWKVVLEEMGIPFIVSTFICTISFKAYPVEWSIAAFALFFFLFLFSGKGLINIIHIIYKHAKLQFKYWKLVAGKNKAIKKQSGLLASLEKKKTSLISDMKLPGTKIAELDALYAYKVKVFESEYNLAREGRDELSPKQLTSF